MKYELRESVRVSKLCQELGLELLGNDTSISAVASLDTVSANTLTFSKSSSDLASLEGIFCVNPTENLEPSVKHSFILCDNPRMTFIKALAWLEDTIGFDQYNEEADISDSATIGEGVVIEKGSKVGKNVFIEPNVTIHRGTIIGDNSVIRSNSSIGSSGFGFERDLSGFPVRFPHLGRVVIGNNVEIGSCTTIAKGTLGDTIIEDNVKLDNLVHIAHNAVVKNGAFVIAGAEISGGVIVGENSWIAPNACTHQKIRIGKNSIVGLGAVVTKDVGANIVVAGNPAKKLKNLKG
ncbi:UDP-3-O-(3-hydroxymyristoyl)glucosamine N-acyltransferase [Idiomarina sp. Sol25]|uniref:UDP-3-O-(3-hydroxymyristoyl)glucosamine N-acyltransferase n=1 Tax=Idiomarina sp. Sol25 TaxID=3064000 RepID=UPI00294AD1B3|nr:UDP-3-O-(3-hydroxymyristoyl)glucosamine N-acyltransferase [Idiomarina sp. Sol25]MDV6328083.1 UDP-3-O-(3-hydroxymyristoyl)glucosamine N-acyltransferase [Idiomarina sp. Sol25]